MSRYLILVLVNTPFILFGVVRSLMLYQTKRINRKSLIGRLLFWVLLFIGLASASKVYTYLLDNKLTQTESLSLFDVVSITGFFWCFTLILALQARVQGLQEKISRLNQSLSIELAEGKNKRKD